MPWNSSPLIYDIALDCQLYTALDSFWCKLESIQRRPYAAQGLLLSLSSSRGHWSDKAHSELAYYTERFHPLLQSFTEDIRKDGGDTPASRNELRQIIAIANASTLRLDLATVKRHGFWLSEELTWTDRLISVLHNQCYAFQKLLEAFRTYPPQLNYIPYFDNSRNLYTFRFEPRIKDDSESNVHTVVTELEHYRQLQSENERIRQHEEFVEIAKGVIQWFPREGDLEPGRLWHHVCVERLRTIDYLIQNKWMIESDSRQAIQVQPINELSRTKKGLTTSSIDITSLPIDEDQFTREEFARLVGQESDSLKSKATEWSKSTSRLRKNQKQVYSYRDSLGVLRMQFKSLSEFLNEPLPETLAEFRIYTEPVRGVS